jgi:hypothetical protein
MNIVVDSFIESRHWKEMRLLAIWFLSLKERLWKEKLLKRNSLR